MKLFSLSSVDGSVTSLRFLLTALVPAVMLAIPLYVSAGVTNLEATMDGAQANAGAGTGSPGLGMASMSYDDVSGVFSWTIVWDGLLAPAVVAHFHGPALPNQNAGVQLPISAVSPSIDSAVIDAGQAADLLAGSWYINVHTPVFPGGEIRGQVQIAAAANDMCEDSSGPLAVDSVTSGSTTGATLDEPPSLDCGTPVTAPGVWYTVTGTGNTMTASTCNDGDPATGGANYDTKISVYCADCETNECIGGQDDDVANCAGFSTKFDWPTEAGATYNVLVHGFIDATGDFDLAILDDGTPSTGANDCDGVSSALDLCPDTVIPESAPTVSLKSNNSALTDASGVFETAGPNPQGVVYTIDDTAGCSCEQIVDNLGLGQGLLKHGCSFSAMDDWLEEVESYCRDCVVSNGTPGCEHGECEATVCAVDPFCCDVSWDSICAAEALDLCVPDICIATDAALDTLPAPVSNGRARELLAEPVSKE